MSILIIFVLILNIKIAGSIISFNTQHLSKKNLKMRIINKEYTNLEKYHTTQGNPIESAEM